MLTCGCVGDLQRRINRLQVQQLGELQRIQHIQRRARQRNRLARPRRLAARAPQLACTVLKNRVSGKSPSLHAVRRAPARTRAAPGRRAERPPQLACITPITGY